MFFPEIALAPNQRRPPTNLTFPKPEPNANLFNTPVQHPSMAPNIKEINDALLSLDLSNHVLTAKYAPLTSEVASSSADTTSPEQQAQTNAPTKLQQQQDLNGSNAVEPSLENNQDGAIDDQESYWDMPHRPELTADEKRRELIDDILRQEEIRQMFTADHIVANLKRDSAVNEHQNMVTAMSESCSDEVEGYWDMPAGDDVLVVETEAQPAVESAVESSLLEETETNIPACLTTKHIVSNLISEGERLSSSTSNDDVTIVVAPHVHDPTHPHYSYWDWDTSPQATNYEAKRRALIEQILEEERARQMTSAGHVVKTILESQAPNSAIASTSSTTNDADESYWSFTPRTADPADTIHAPHTRDLNHPLADYWTWDTSPKSADEQRQVLIDWILREEAARQSTCMDAVVQGLIQSASFGTGNEIAVEEAKETAEGYWDW